MYIIIILQQVLNLVRRQHPQKYTDHAMEVFNKSLQFQSASETSIYDNVDIDDDPTSSEQQTSHPYVNVNFDVQPAGPIIIHMKHIANNFN